MPERQEYCCLPFCGNAGSWVNPIEMHHVVPRSRGGAGGDNLVPICRECHSAHHSDARMRLTFAGDRVTRADGRCGELVLGDRDHLDVVA